MFRSCLHNPKDSLLNTPPKLFRNNACFQMNSVLKLLRSFHCVLEEFKIIMGNYFVGWAKPSGDLLFLSKRSQQMINKVNNSVKQAKLNGHDRF